MSSKNNHEHFNILRKIDNKPNYSQRELAKELGMSLGKLNYCINALVKKGLVKIENFKKNPNKLSYRYLLTSKGIALKLNLTISFMKKKMNEYDELKNEYKKNTEKFNSKR